MRILCLLGWHSWKRTTKSKSIDGTIKNYFKCIHCSNKKKVENLNKPFNYLMRLD